MSDVLAARIIEPVARASVSGLQDTHTLGADSAILEKSVQSGTSKHV